MHSISVVMTTFNGEKFLVEQLESILNQTRVPHEIIVVDDLSTDNTYKILQDYRSKYPETLKVYQNKSRLGINGNFERAARLSTGDLILFSDQDDVWDRVKIQTMVDHLGGSGLLYSNAVIIDEHGYVLCKDELEFHGVPPIAGRPLVYLLQSNTISGHNILVTRKLLNTAVPFPIEIVYDQWLGIVACLSEGISFIDQALVKHRMHNSNSINNPNIRKKVDKSSRRKISKLFAYKRDSQKRLSILKRVLDIGSYDKNSMEIVCRYVEHLTYAKSSFFNFRLYNILLKNLILLCKYVEPKKLKKIAHKMSRGELYFRVFRY